MIEYTLTHDPNMGEPLSAVLHIPQHIDFQHWFKSKPVQEFLRALRRARVIPFGKMVKKLGNGNILMIDSLAEKFIREHSLDVEHQYRIDKELFYKNPPNLK